MNQEQTETVLSRMAQTLESLESRLKSMEAVKAESPTASSASLAEPAAPPVRNDKENERKAIQKWVSGLTPDLYVKLGQKLGFVELEEPVQEETPAAPAAVATMAEPAPEPEVEFSRQPKEGWDFVPALNCYVKVR